MLAEWGERLAKLLGERSDYGVEMRSPALKKENDYLKQYPLSNLLPYESYDPTTELYHNRDSIGFIIEGSPLCGADPQALDALTNLLKDKLPECATLHILLYANPNITNQVENWKNHRTQRQDDIFRQLAETRANFLMEGSRNSPIESEKTTFRNFELYIDVTLPLDTAIKKAIDIKNDVMDTFKQLQMQVRVVSAKKFKKLMYPLINPTLLYEQNIPTWEEEESLANQLVEPGNSVQVTRNGVFFNEGEMCNKSFRITEYPAPWDQWKMGDLIGDAFNSTLRLGCPFLLSFTIYIPVGDKENRRAHAKSLRASQQANSPFARFMPKIHKVHQEWKRTMAKLEEGDKLLKTCFQITLLAPQKKLYAHESELKALLQHKKWKYSSCPYIQLPAWLLSLPMMMTEQAAEDVKLFNFFKSLHASEISQVAPLQGEAKGGTSPGVALIGRRGQIQYVDPFSNSSGNYNMTIAGKSGSGKSVFTQELIMSLVGNGGQVWVIDVGRSYQKMTELLEGQFIVFSDQSNISLNPFTHINDLHAEGHLKLLKPLFAQMASPNRELHDLEKSYIEQAIIASWEKHKQLTTVNHIAEWLNQQSDGRARDLGSMLFSYTEQGMYGSYFSGPCNLDFTNDLICLELEELKGKKDLQSVVLLLLVFQITQRMYLGDRLKRISCIIDEAWDLLAGVQGASFIEEGCRRARKYNGNFITATQSVNDFFKNAAAQAAFENSDWQILLSHKKEAIDQLMSYGRLNLDSQEERLFRSLRTVHGQFAELLVRGPEYRFAGRLILDRFSNTLYSTKGDEFATILQLRKQGYSLIEAINHVNQKLGMAT